MTGLLSAGASGRDFLAALTIGADIMYRIGAAAIEPQQAVDANARPTAYEQGLALPTVLQGLQLMDLSGELIAASGGVVES